MVALINILGFLSLCCILSWRGDEALVSCAPVAAALWILGLYVLALFRLLVLVDFICVLLLLLCLYLFYRRHGKGWFRALSRLLLSPSALALYTVLLVAFLLLRGILITNRDDLGCWALEVKSITYFGGFAPKAQHASILYGSYYPGVTLFRWWTGHIASAYFDGMMVVGSAWLFVLLLAPMFTLLRCPRPLAPFFGIAIAGILLLLPSSIDIMCYMNLCAELPMSAAFAGLLFTAFHSEEKQRPQLLASYFFCLFFFKAAGIVFALSLLVLLMLIIRGGYMLLPGRSAPRAQILGLARLSLPCLLPSLSWHLFCAIMGRSDYFTLSVPTAEAAPAGFWDSYGGPYLESLFRGFFTYPLHVVEDAVIDLSAFAIVLMFLALCLLAAWRLPRLRREFRAYSLYIIAVAVLLFWGLYLVHCFVFREDAYFSPEYMCYTVSRYGLPFFLGSFIFLFYSLMQHGLELLRRPFAKLVFTGLCAGFILSMSCIWTVYYRTVDYSQPNASALAQTEKLNVLCADFLDGIEKLSDEKYPLRFIFVCDESEEYTYEDQVRLQYMAAPCSIYTITRSPGQPAADISAAAEHYSADYVYFLSEGIFLSPAELDNPA